MANSSDSSLFVFIPLIRVNLCFSVLEICFEVVNDGKRRRLVSSNFAYGIFCLKFDQNWDCCGIDSVCKNWLTMSDVCESWETLADNLDVSCPNYELVFSLFSFTEN